MDRVYGVHWFRFVTRNDSVDRVADLIVGISGGEFVSGPPSRSFNQERTLKHTSGATIHFGASSENQPIVVEVPGEVCDVVPSDHLACWALECVGLVSRIDLACDLNPPEKARPYMLQMKRVFRAGRCTTRIRPDSLEYVENDRIGEGHTLYIGQRGKDAQQFLRVYDRRGPLRLEWQFQPKDKAVREWIPTTLNDKGPAPLWRSLARGCIWPMRWYRDLLDGESAERPVVPKKLAGLERLLGAVGAQYGDGLAAAVAAIGVDAVVAEVIKENENRNREQVRRAKQFKLEAAGLGIQTCEVENAENEATSGI